MEVTYKYHSWDYGHIQGMSITVRIKKYVWQDGLRIRSTYYNTAVESHMKERLMKSFWRRIGAA